ncbi:hypothetical protein Avbf_02198 [Armadillidium vulgare]|nr:hypothetical protein Avbf_02198 [Armadillidium vulgare]
MIKLFQENQSCPNCRTEIRGNETSLPINYSVLKVAEIYKTKNCSEGEIMTSIEDMKKKCMERKEILSMKKSSITSSLEVLDEYLTKLEELTASEKQRVDSVKAKNFLKEVDEELKKTDDVIRSDDLKSSMSINLSSFKDSKDYLLEIYKRLQNKEKVFAVHKINHDVKYGKVSLFGNQLFFNSLSLSEVPKNSSLIWVS